MNSFSRSVSKIPSHSLVKAQPNRNTTLKRKRPDEPIQRCVLPKLTPSHEVQTRRISVLTGPSKTGTPIVSDLNPSKPITSLNSLNSISLTAGTPVYNNNSNKKDSGLTSAISKETKEKTDAKTSKSTDQVKTQGRSTMMSLSPVKKTLNIDHYEMLENVCKEVDTEKDNLLSNLNNIVEELGEKHNPLLEDSQKLAIIEDHFDKKKTEQKEEIDRLHYKINTLKDSQTHLSKMLSAKKDKVQQVEEQKVSIELNIMKYNESITKTKCNLSALLKKNEDLNTFIYNVEEAIRNTKSKIRYRYREISCEEKKIMILDGLITEKKRCIAFTPQK